MKTKITEAEALEATIEIWTELADKGCSKQESQAVKKYTKKFGRIPYGCPLCLFSGQISEFLAQLDVKKCRSFCLYGKKFGPCFTNKRPYIHWAKAESPKWMKYWASKLLEQLKSI